ncbi:glycoside hydrolase family 6 protein [Podospora aff. communis PSN243]|uniref:Glucanase n=1 Tax=Podospora aff. communis PSN243 TaxID=3040156 RepID=A0AAV9G3I2_9PEZI|nr:glycoside hydrolase family 6 protein [Podospora aff. communis PSN243]
MRVTSLVAALSAVGVVSARPPPGKGNHKDKLCKDTNPFEGKQQFVNPSWAAKLDETHAAFKAQGDAENAARVRKIQKNMSTFVWVSRISELPRIDDAIKAARQAQRKTKKKQIVGLVLYNLPDRDCSAGESAGELKSAENGLERYRTEFVKPYVDKVKSAPDLEFAIVLEPDSLGNLVTNMGIEFCAQAADVYREGIAHAISQLQFKNVHLYIDAAHGGWLGWNDNLPLAAKEFATVVELAGNGTNKIRGFATNVSNYNPFNATGVRENYTEWSNSWDEGNYATSLAPFLEEEGLPANFIIDQGRVHLPGAREEWGEWCNVHPAGFGHAPTTKVDNPVVDALAWIKPGGESDGQCGFEGAPRAGEWHDEYVQMLVKNAHPSVYA